MNETPGNLPTMLFDGDCGFCRRWIRKWNRITGGRVRYLPYQEAVSQYQQVTAQQCAEAVQLVLPDGTVFGGARAVFKALAIGGKYPWLLRVYESQPLCAWFAECCYRLVARRRTFFSRIA